MLGTLGPRGLAARASCCLEVHDVCGILWKFLWKLGKMGWFARLGWVLPHQPWRRHRTLISTHSSASIPILLPHAAKYLKEKTLVNVGKPSFSAHITRGTLQYPLSLTTSFSAVSDTTHVTKIASSGVYTRAKQKCVHTQLRFTDVLFRGTC